MYGTIYEFETLPNVGEQNPQRVTRPAPQARRGRAVPLVGIIRNPRSHRNKGNAPEMEDCSNILTETPRTRADLHRVLESFAQRGIDYLVVDGGDGTVRDVLTCGADVFDDQWPAVMVLPKGKTNALAIDLGLPNHWSLAEALAAAHRGNTLVRSPLRISSKDGSAGCIQGFILGTGAFALATEAGQEAHRRGAFNSFAVGLTVLWVIIQTLFGRAGNRWRSCTPTRLIDHKTGQDVPYNGPGNPDERFMAVATTFENFPLGAQPFGRNISSGMKFAVIDWPVRWVIAMLPLIMMFGIVGRILDRAGTHHFATPAIDLDIGGSFILDGEAFPAGDYVLEEGPPITFVVP